MLSTFFGPIKQIHSAVISVYFIDSSTVNVFVQQADVLLSLSGTQMPSAGLGLGGSQLAPAGLGGSQLAQIGLGGTSVVGSTQQPSTFPALSMPTPMVPLAQSRSQPLSQPQGVGPGQQSPLTSAFSTPLPAGTPSILTGWCHEAHTSSLGTRLKGKTQCSTYYICSIKHICPN